MNSAQIELEHVNYSYPGFAPALRDITFSVRDRESVGLIGANGVGKSTLLKLLVGLNPDYEGQILIDRIPVNKKNLPVIREKIGYVFQDSDSQLFMTRVADDVAFAPRNYGLPEDEVRRRTDRALESIGIESLKHRQIHQLSGGEKKMVSIATILAMTPSIILMDEPSIALDPGNRRRLIRILNQLNQTKIIASHDLDMILETCSRVILMADGKIIQDGDASDILSDQTLLEAHGLELPLCMQRI